MKADGQPITPGFDSLETNKRLALLDQWAQNPQAERIPELLKISKRDPDPHIRAKAADLCRKIAEGLEHPRDPYGQFRI